MRRREFITLLGGATTWPFIARGQQPERMRRIGVLVGLAENDPEIKARLAGLRQGLEKFGWLEGRNVHIDYRFAPAGAHAQSLARELVALQPDLIFAQTTPAARAAQAETRTIPIVFSVADPIGLGLVASLPRPGGNATGFLQYEEGITGKWLSMLKEIAPNLTRAALVANPKTTSFDYFLGSAEALAPSLAIEIVPKPVENSSADIQRAIELFAREPNGGLVLPPDTTTMLHRNLIISLAAEYNLPAVYAIAHFRRSRWSHVLWTDFVDMYRQLATFVDRILRGASPADLPVQVPTKYETIVNLKTAKTLGLHVPPSLLVRADEVME